MPERISLLESYDNKDVITQIYRLVQIVDSGTYKALAVSRDGNDIRFVFTTNDDVQHTYAVPDAGITDVSGSAVGSQVTVTFTMTDGTTKSFTYTATGGVTIDTDQTVTGMKVFSAASTNFTHDVDVGADLNVGGTVEANELAVDTNATVDGNLAVGGNASITGNITGNVTIEGDLDVGNLAIEASGNRSIISNENGVVVNGHDLNNAATTNEINHYTKEQYFDTWGMYGPNHIKFKGNAPTEWKTIGSVNGNNEYKPVMQFNNNEIQIVGDKVYRGSAVPANADSRSIITKAFVASTDGSTNNLMHTIADEPINGNKVNTGRWDRKTADHTLGETTAVYWEGLMNDLVDVNNDYIARTNMVSASTDGTTRIMLARVRTKNTNGDIISTQVQLNISKNGSCSLTMVDTHGVYHTLFSYGGE